MIAVSPRRWRAYVAIGDSFSEGLNDADPERPGSFRGWTDRLAEHLAVVAAKDGEELRYANLAIRGRKVDDIVGRQVAEALALGPDLVSLVGGGNDILRPKADIEAITAAVDEAVATIRATGADVLLATPTDTIDAGPLLGRTRTRSAVYTAHLFTIAQRHGCYIVNQWGARFLRDWRLWSDDRIHMTAEGHRRIALEAFSSLGHEPEDLEWRTPLPPRPRPTRVETARGNAEWLRTHVRPWVHRRLTGRSSGDGITPKRPTLEVLAPPTVADRVDR